MWDLPGAGTSGNAVILDGTAPTAVTLRRPDGHDAVPPIAGTYLDYRRLIDAVPPIATSTVDRLALRTAAAVTSPEGTAVRLIATGAGLRVGDVDVEAKVVGDATMVALNPQYLLDRLNAVAPRMTVDLEVSGQHTPLVLLAAGMTGHYLLIPVRVDNAAPV